MPVYEFLCRKCNKEFTLVLRVEEYERGGFSCPQCQSTDVERAMTAFSVITSKKS